MLQDACSVPWVPQLQPNKPFTALSVLVGKGQGQPDAMQQEAERCGLLFSSDHP